MGFQFALADMTTLNSAPILLILRPDKSFSAFIAYNQQYLFLHSAVFCWRYQLPTLSAETMILNRNPYDIAAIA